MICECKQEESNHNLVEINPKAWKKRVYTVFWKEGLDLTMVTVPTFHYIKKSLLSWPAMQLIHTLIHSTVLNPALIRSPHRVPTCSWWLLCFVLLRVNTVTPGCDAGDLPLSVNYRDPANLLFKPRRIWKRPVLSRCPACCLSVGGLEERPLLGEGVFLAGSSTPIRPVPGLTRSWGSRRCANVPFCGFSVQHDRYATFGKHSLYWLVMAPEEFGPYFRSSLPYSVY